MIRAYDEAVTRLGQTTRTQRTLRSCGLLVAAVLLGLLGMHGLGPVPGIHDQAGHDRTAAIAHTSVVMSMPGECDHGGGGCSGHVAHADPTCASAAVSGTPVVVPVLQPDVTVNCRQPDERVPPASGGPDGGRAPPSLSELQLLRI
jgi:hypothetical protein